MYGSERKYHKGTMDTKSPTTHTSANPPLHSTRHKYAHTQEDTRGWGTRTTPLRRTLSLRINVAIQSHSLARFNYFISNRFIHLFSNKFSISSSDIFISITITKQASLSVFNWKSSYLFTCQ